jgi:hypothetical protein
MRDMDDYLARKRSELGLDRADQLSEIQALIETWYPGQIRAKSLNNGLLQLVTPSSVVASELRLRQVDLMHRLKDVNRIRITIESI